MAKKERVLLVEPNFPIPRKSRNHANFLPIGLLKLGAFHLKRGDEVLLVRGNQKVQFSPDKVLITSLFTYWAEYVWQSVHFYKALYPKASVIVGGIYASLMPDHCKKSGCDKVFIGIHDGAEECEPAYGLLNCQNGSKVDYQIIHASRGCSRRCSFCGTWKIEDECSFKKTLLNEIKAKKLVFYDNNFLNNPHIEDILNELKELKKNKRIDWCESQSGFDGRILAEKPQLARKLKEAGFRSPRIAWDGKYSDHKKIRQQICLLKRAGYRSKDIFIFVLYNWEIPFEKMEQKRKKCWEWKTQIADCRYRPLDQTFDYFNSKKEQTNLDYHIHKKWTDRDIKRFRKNVRRQNICVRQDVSFYSRRLESRVISKTETRRLKVLKKKEILKRLEDAWFPGDKK